MAVGRGRHRSVTPPPMASSPGGPRQLQPFAQFAHVRDDQVGRDGEGDGVLGGRLAAEDHTEATPPAGPSPCPCRPGRPPWPPDASARPSRPHRSRIIDGSGLPSTVGVRPVAAVRQAQREPQSTRIVGSSVGQTRSGWVAMKGRPQADPVRGPAEPLVGEGGVESHDDGPGFVPRHEEARLLELEGRARPCPGRRSRPTSRGGVAEVGDGRIRRREDPFLGRIDPEPAQLPDVIRLAQRRVVGQEGMADAQPVAGDQGKGGSRQIAGLPR